MSLDESRLVTTYGRLFRRKSILLESKRPMVTKLGSLLLFLNSYNYFSRKNLCQPTHIQLFKEGKVNTVLYYFVLLFQTPAGFVLFQTAQYVVLVHATDQGSPPLSATATVNIDVTDYNDNPPLFVHPNTTAVLQVTINW